MKLSTIKPNPKNPRLIRDSRYQKLINSINEFPKMFTARPIITDENWVVLGGNQRLRALLELGFKEIPDHWVRKIEDFTEEEKKRFIIVDNVGFGEPDYDLLEQHFDRYENEGWGFEYPDYMDDTMDEPEDVNSISETVNFNIKCKDINQLHELQTKLNVNGQRMNYDEFLTATGL